MYKVQLYKDAAKYYEKLEAKMQKRINVAIEDIIKSPFEGMHIKKLKGRLITHVTRGTVGHGPLVHRRLIKTCFPSFVRRGEGR